MGSSLSCTTDCGSSANLSLARPTRLKQRPTMSAETLPRDPIAIRKRLSSSASTPRLASFHHGLCRPCDEIAAWLSDHGAAAERVGAAESYHVCDLRMADRDPSCPLCGFLFSVAVDAAALACLPGAVSKGVYSLHASTFGAVFLDAEDRRWCSGDDDPTVFFISPLFSFGTKAKDWALRFNSCFMSLASRPSGTFARHLSPHADLDVVSQWIQHCNRGHTHPDCNPAPALSVAEFTVVDCETRTLQIWPRGARYVTLSYVWGMDPAEAPVDGALPETLPELIQDAIVVALRLGYRYLWIDRCCIPQDDETVRHSLIRNMDKVYSESSLTIIASAAD